MTVELELCGVEEVKDGEHDLTLEVREVKVDDLSVGVAVEGVGESVAVRAKRDAVGVHVTAIRLDDNVAALLVLAPASG